MFSSLELVFFFKQLHHLISSGISLYPAIELIYLDIGSNKLKKPLQLILSALREGESLSNILHSKLNVDLFITNVIKVGENNGELGQALNKACQYLEQKISLKNKIILALSYPAILFTFGIIIVTIVVRTVIPKYLEIFQSYEIELPTPTRILLKVYELFTSYWWNIPLVMIVTGLIVYLLFKKDIKMFLSKTSFSIPIYGTFKYYITLMNFLSNLGSLHNSGISIVKSLQLSIATTNNAFFKHQLTGVIQKIIEGEKLSIALWNTRFFPAIVIKMIMVGEETAKLDKMLLQLTDYLNSELEIELQRFIVLIAPVCMVFIGLFVIFIALALLLPTFNIVKVLHIN
ncbi:MAG: hypothetical protein A2Y40_05825 [Candidatus Margulisbacteria bacterium GWF2_35_9]|nr:MAG: hypothetical protein A2Y40_05825 [Candidatus Margulisbacteria bacterium GWF2_35_9]